MGLNLLYVHDKYMTDIIFRANRSKITTVTLDNKTDSHHYQGNALANARQTWKAGWSLHENKCYCFLDHPVKGQRHGVIAHQQCFKLISAEYFFPVS